MTTYNTGNPIGSTDARDRSDNSENLDFAINSLSPSFVDRLGRTRDTLEGVYQKSAYYRAGTFDAGYTLTNNRQTLAYGNVEYSWSGSFPKVVAAGSTPATTGGVGAGAWVDRTESTLRSDLTTYFNISPERVSIRDYRVWGDSSWLNAFQRLANAIQPNETVTVDIPPGIYTTDLMQPITFAEGLDVTFNANGAKILSATHGIAKNDGAINWLFGAESSVRVNGLTIDHITPPDYTTGNGVAYCSALQIRPSSASVKLALVETFGVRILSGYWAGIRVQARNYRSLYDYVRNCKGTGIFIGEAEGSVSIIGASSKNTSDDCIYVACAPTLTGGDVEISNCRVGENYAKGIGVGGYQGIILSKNIITNTGGGGIAVWKEEGADIWAPTNSILIDGNIILNAGSSNAVVGTGHGLWLQDIAASNYIKYFIISNNVIKGSQRFGAWIASADNYAIHGNIIQNSGLSGLSLGGPTYTNSKGTVKNNKILSNFGSGVLANNCTDLRVSSNEIRDNTAYGINVTNCTGGFAKDNQTSGNTSGAVYKSGGTIGVELIDNGITPASGFTQDASAPIRWSLYPSANDTTKANKIELKGKMSFSGTASTTQIFANLGGAAQPAYDRFVTVSLLSTASGWVTRTARIAASSNALATIYNCPTDITMISLEGCSYTI